MEVVWRGWIVGVGVGGGVDRKNGLDYALCVKMEIEAPRGFKLDSFPLEIGGVESTPWLCALWIPNVPLTS